MTHDDFSSAPQNHTEEESAEAGKSAVAQVLSSGPRGTMIIAGVAVGMLFVGWLLFYFLLFMRRGYVG